ncbi:hypothetical protein HPB49_019387 [Dermacentor silvarum]|uniref:Uncharacterized protein n=1 Tax=Dermacentor silvarum TaxID=543639 RepID=A0ACB8D7J8_DERSI|nr:hypothetical protein HPB49_019387 [Dermacentor silvarum]
MLEGKKRRSKSGDNFTETAPDATRKSAISVTEVSSSISISDSITEATTVVHKSSSDGTIVGKRSISFGTPRNKPAKARTPSSGARSGKGSSQVSVLTVSISDSEDVDPRGPPQSRRARALLTPRSRPESPPWTSTQPTQHVTRSCSRHLAMQRAAQMRGYSRSPSPKPGYAVASGRMYSASPTRVRSPMRVPSPRRTVFQVLDESAYYAEPVVRDRARLMRREDQRFQMAADDPKPQRDGKWHEPKLRVSYAARVPSRGSHSDSSVSYSVSSKTALDYERGDSPPGYYRTASQLDRYREPSRARSYSSTPQLCYEDSPSRTYRDHSPTRGYVEGLRNASGVPTDDRDVSLSRISGYSSPKAGCQGSTGKMLVSVSSSRLVRSASLPRDSPSTSAPRVSRRGSQSRLAREASAFRGARSTSPRQSRSMSPRKPDTSLARIKVRAASSLHLGYETSSSRTESSRRLTRRASPDWLERNGLLPKGPLSPPPPKPPVPPPMPPPKGFSMGPLGFESTSTSASAIRITMSPPPMPPVPPMLPPPTPTEIAALQAVTITMKDLGREQSSSEHELCAAELQRQILEKQQLQLEQLLQLQQTQDFHPLEDVDEQQLQQQLKELQKVLQQQEGAPVLQVQFQSPADPSGKPSTPLAQSVLQVQFQSPSQPLPQVFQAQIPTRAESPGVIQVQLQSPIAPSEPQQTESFSQITSRVAHPEQPGVLQVQLQSPLDFQAQPVSTQETTQPGEVSILQAQLQSAVDFSAPAGPSQVDQLSVLQSPLEPKSTASDHAGLFQMQLQGLMDFSQQPLAQQQSDQLGAMQAQLQSQLGFPMQASSQAQQPGQPGVIQMQFGSPSTASTGFIGQQTAQESLLDQTFLQSSTPQMDFSGQLMPEVHVAGSSIPQIGLSYQTMSQMEQSMHQTGQLDQLGPSMQDQSFLQMQMQSPLMTSADFSSQPLLQSPFPCQEMSQEQGLGQNMLLEQQKRQFSLQMNHGTSSMSNFMQESVQAMQASGHGIPAMQGMQDWAREQIPGEPMPYMQEWGSAMHMPGQHFQMSERMPGTAMRDARRQAMNQNSLFNQTPPQELPFSRGMSRKVAPSSSVQIMNEMMQEDLLASRSSPQMQIAERRMEVQPSAESPFRDPFQQRSQPHTVVMFQSHRSHQNSSCRNHRSHRNPRSHQSLRSLRKHRSSNSNSSLRRSSSNSRNKFTKSSSKQRKIVSHVCSRFRYP